MKYHVRGKKLPALYESIVQHAQAADPEAVLTMRGRLSAQESVRRGYRKHAKRRALQSPPKEFDYEDEDY